MVVIRIPNTNPTVREIHRRMVAAGLNNYSFAKKVGVNETYFRDMYRSPTSNGPRLMHLPAIAAALDCTPDQLLHPESEQATVAEPNLGGEENQAEEIALIGLWRVLSVEARRRIMRAIIRELSRGQTTPLPDNGD